MGSCRHLHCSREKLVSGVELIVRRPGHLVDANESHDGDEMRDAASDDDGEMSSRLLMMSVSMTSLSMSAMQSRYEFWEGH